MHFDVKAVLHAQSQITKSQNWAQNDAPSTGSILYAIQICVQVHHYLDNASRPEG